MSMKRQADGHPGLQGTDDSGTSTQSPTAGALPEEFTRTVKKRLSTSSRTGQACDRCKVRKIRCDGLAGGCSPCRQNNTECRTTDRISQRAVPRGYIEQLETKCGQLENRVRELEAALASTSITPQHSHLLASVAVAANNVDPNLDWAGQNGLKRHWDFPGSDALKTEAVNVQSIPFQSSFGMSNGQGGMDSLSIGVAPEQRSSDDKKPLWRSRNTGDQIVGMYSGNSYLNSMRASALSVLGIEIDLADLMGTPEPPVTQNWMTSSGQIIDSSEINNFDDSLRSCIQSIFNTTQPPMAKVELPPKAETDGLVDFYFFSTHPYLPFLHRPSFQAELDRMYDKDYRTTPAQTVIVHMVIAMSLWQIATRHISSVDLKTPAEMQRPDTSRAYKHYHYSLSLVHYLLDCSSLEDCQAMLAIVCFTRSFARPGPSYMLVKRCNAIVFELGLHRSTKHTHQSTGTPPNALEDEVRKRTFWCALAIDVGISTKLGRPVSFHKVDHDIEKPERIDDEFITANGFLKPPAGPDEICSFDVAYGLFVVAEFTVEIYGKIYGVEKPSPEDYWPLVVSIENKMKAWKEALPNHLKYDPSAPKIETRIHSGNLMLWYNELRILLRHPSLSLSASPSNNSDNLTICVESSRNILDIIDTLRRENHLDTTWYATAVPLLATSTILFSIWEKRDTVTQNEIARVKSDMDLAVDLMKDYGKLHAKSNRLQEIVTLLTNNTMIMLNEKHGRGTPNMQMYPRGSMSSQTGFSAASASPMLKSSSPTPLVTRHSQVMPQQNHHFGYSPQSNEQNSNSMFVDPSLSSIEDSSNSTSTEPYSADADNAASQTAAAALSAAAQNAHQQFMYPNQSNSTPPHPLSADSRPQQQFTGWWNGGNDSWKEYINNVTGLVPQQADAYPASAALMALGQQGQAQPQGQQTAELVGGRPDQQQIGNNGWGMINMYEFSDAGASRAAGGNESERGMGL